MCVCHLIEINYLLSSFSAFLCVWVKPSCSVRGDGCVFSHWDVSMSVAGMISQCLHSNLASWGASVPSRQTVTYPCECWLALGSSKGCSCAAFLFQSSPWGGTVQDHYHYCGTSSHSGNIRCCGKPYKSQWTILSSTWTSLSMPRLPAADNQLSQRQHCWVTLSDNTLGRSLRSSTVVCSGDSYCLRDMI